MTAQWTSHEDGHERGTWADWRSAVNHETAVIGTADDVINVEITSHRDGEPRTIRISGCGREIVIWAVA